MGGILLKPGATPAEVYLSQEASRRGIAYPHPLKDILDVSIPRDVKTLFGLCRYFFCFDPLVHAAVRNMAVYPLTKLSLTSAKHPVMAKELLDMLHNRFSLTRTLIGMMIDYYVYGNAFLMVNTLRSTTTPHFTRVPVTEMSLDEDPLTGQTRYIWLVSPAMRRMIQNKDSVEHREDYGRFRDEYPGADVIEAAVRENRGVVLDPQYMFHMKIEADSSSGNHWGMPIIQPVLKTLFYRNILRKAQEALAREHIVPMRIFYLQPLDKEAFDLAGWSHAAGELAKQISKAAMDPNYKIVAPVPVGVTMAGGQGRSLLVAPEIQQVEDEALAGMLVPREFVFGGLSYSGASVSLRMIENRVANTRQSLRELVQFMLRALIGYTASRDTVVDLLDFDVQFANLRSIDDVQQKQLLINLNSVGKLPDELLYTTMEYDADAVKDGLLRDIKFRAQMAKEQMKLDAELQAFSMATGMPVQDPNQSQQDPNQPQDSQQQGQQPQSQQSTASGTQGGGMTLPDIVAYLQELDPEEQRSILQDLPDDVRQQVMSLMTAPDAAEGIDMRPMPEQLPPRRVQ